MRFFLPFSLLFLFLFACKKEELPLLKDIVIEEVSLNGVNVENNATLYGVSYNEQKLEVLFNDVVDTSLFDSGRLFFTGFPGIEYSYHFNANGKRLNISIDSDLLPLSSYRMVFEQGDNLGGTIDEEFSFRFNTRIDSSYKFPVITDEELLTLVQKQTFRYFWDYAHPVSGLIRERLNSGDLVTSGGSGFGLMAILVGVERGFITRSEGFERLNTIVEFLDHPNTRRFHGAFPHWFNGSSGATIPFSTKDDGADLVETAFLMQGLLTVKQYFKTGNAQEQIMCQKIQQLYEEVEWDWFRKDGENVLYWHWSPNYGWDMNHKIRGWDESLIVYILASGSPTHPIPAEVYHQGWARNGAYPMVNGKTFYNIQLPLGVDYGGPLFFSHYSFLGLDPRNLSDQYANYWTQNIAHTLINRAYCISNPKNYVGYSKDCWGLTASDIQDGYTASSPTNDRGVIAPTAAISAMPYTPQESLKALHFYYYILGDKLWGEYGFKDAFNLTSTWFANSYLAIDQGPIICMIENYRTALLWNLFMEVPEVQAGLQLLEFSY